MLLLVITISTNQISDASLLANQNAAFGADVRMLIIANQKVASMHTSP